MISQSNNAEILFELFNRLTIIVDPWNGGHNINIYFYYKKKLNILTYKNKIIFIHIKKLILKKKISFLKI